MLRRCLVCLLLCGGTSRLPGQHGGPPTSLRLPRHFGDGMVVQRDAPIPVWGWAAPGAQVTVSFRGAARAATAGPEGAWRVMLPEAPAGGPYALDVESDGSRIHVADVLAGDVWVASGQSNMEFPVGIAKNAAQEVAAAHDSLIRELRVPHSWSDGPEDDLAGGAWVPADPAHVGEFSAVAYFFAREIRRTVPVPIGIVNITWGGSAIETWLSREAQGLTDSAWAEVQRRESDRVAAILDTLRSRLGALPTADSGLVGGRALWGDPALDLASWAGIPVPSAWEQSGFPGLDGVAWYRTDFTLTEGEAARGVRLSLGVIDDDEITWVNGVLVGRTEGYNRRRLYDVPAAALRGGRNVLAVRVTDGGGGGGINGDPASVYLEVGAERRSLAGRWRFRVGQVSVQPDGQRINKIPAVLYNRMVHPLLPMAVKGILWYQGESNANNPAQARAYRGQFLQLIESWRRAWNGGNRGAFPFLWVQLPSYGAADPVPSDRGGWAIQRESMEAALRLPNTGRAITVDLDEAANLHPLNKQDVGSRLALVARKVAYGENVLASGPSYRRHTIRDGRMVVRFDHAGDGLVARSEDGAIGAFAIAGEDRKFVWAKARLEGDHVVVWSEAVPHPVAVRYAWADNPPTPNLYNRAGLPAVPFRTDRW